MLRDQARSQSLPDKRRILTLVWCLIDKQSNLADIVHDHIL